MRSDDGNGGGGGDNDDNDDDDDDDDDDENDDNAAAAACLQASRQSMVWKGRFAGAGLMFHMHCICPNGRTRAALRRTQRQACP